MDDDRLAVNREEQRALYGAPVGELVRAVTGPLGFSQAATAGILGLSPAMLSQLVTGHRVRIGNPRVLHRLRLLLALAQESPRLSRRTLAGRIAEIGRARDDLTTAERPGVRTAARAVSRVSPVPAASAAHLVADLLRSAATPDELDRAATVLDDVAPGLAEILRVHGLGAPVDEE